MKRMYRLDFIINCGCLLLLLNMCGDLGIFKYILGVLIILTSISIALYHFLDDMMNMRYSNLARGDHPSLYNIYDAKYCLYIGHRPETVKNYAMFVDKLVSCQRNILAEIEAVLNIPSSYPPTVSGLDDELRTQYIEFSLLKKYSYALTIENNMLRIEKDILSEYINHHENPAKPTLLYKLLSVWNIKRTDFIDTIEVVAMLKSLNTEIYNKKLELKRCQLFHTTGKEEYLDYISQVDKIYYHVKDHLDKYAQQCMLDAMIIF